ncbi:YfhO family protein, partial [bacterium]|nr:YfhO family protein [bacterium]
MKEKAKVIYSLSFLLPIFVLFVGFIFLHIFPLGSRSFLYWDTNYQHINFLSYFKSIFTTNNDFFYSFANLGGNNMLDFSAYYNYFSPLNIILFLFPDKYINIALELIMLIKIGLCGLTFSYFLTKEVKESYLSIIFALSYALSMHTLITTMT